VALETGPSDCTCDWVCLGGDLDGSAGCWSRLGPLGLKKHLRCCCRTPGGHRAPSIAAEPCCPAPAFARAGYSGYSASCPPRRPPGSSWRTCALQATKRPPVYARWLNFQPSPPPPPRPFPRPLPRATTTPAKNFLWTSKTPRCPLRSLRLGRYWHLVLLSGSSAPPLLQEHNFRPLYLENERGQPPCPGGQPASLLLCCLLREASEPRARQ
jgi:hypothetical protein